MRRTYATLAVVALFAGALGGQSVKTRLGQLSAKNMVEEQQIATEPTVLAQCDGCDCCPLVDIPCELGCAKTAGVTTHCENSNVYEIKKIPDTLYKEIEQSNCCAYSESNQEASGQKTKTRTYTINGAITVEECVSICGNECAHECSNGREQKTTTGYTAAEDNLECLPECGCHPSDD